MEGATPETLRFAHGVLSAGGWRCTPFMATGDDMGRRHEMTWATGGDVVMGVTW